MIYVFTTILSLHTLPTKLLPIRKSCPFSASMTGSLPKRSLSLPWVEKRASIAPSLWSSPWKICANRWRNLAVDSWWRWRGQRIFYRSLSSQTKKQPLSLQQRPAQKRKKSIAASNKPWKTKEWATLSTFGVTILSTSMTYRRASGLCFRIQPFHSWERRTKYPYETCFPHLSQASFQD